MNWIKKGFLVGVMTVVLPVMAAESLMKNPKSLKYLDLELPFRCSPVTEDEGEGLSTTVALRDVDFSVRLTAQTNLLPRYQVNGFFFSYKTVDVAVAELLEEAGIKVVAKEGKYTTLSAQDLKGELSSVLEELLDQGNLFYTYQADSKTLFLEHKVRAVVQLPQNKLVMMAVLDALNGKHLEPVITDWKNFQFVLNLTRSELNEVQNLLASMLKERYILAVQVKLYDINSKDSKVHWQNILNRFGITKVSILQNGLIGQALTLTPPASEDEFFEAMKGDFSPQFIAAGKVVVPSGWRTRFNFNQCAPRMSYPELSMFLRTSIKKKNEAQTVLTIDSSSGEVASFDIINNLDQKVMVIGVPIPEQPHKELLVSLQFHFIQLIKKGEQNYIR